MINSMPKVVKDYEELDQNINQYPFEQNYNQVLKNVRENRKIYKKMILTKGLPGTFFTSAVVGMVAFNSHFQVFPWWLNLSLASFWGYYGIYTAFYDDLLDIKEARKEYLTSKETLLEIKKWLKNIQKIAKEKQLDINLQELIHIEPSDINSIDPSVKNKSFHMYTLKEDISDFSYQKKKTVHPYS